MSEIKERDQMLRQATQVWAMLEDMSENNPSGYKAFIKNQMDEEAKYNELPKAFIKIDAEMTVCYYFFEY